MGSTVSLQFKDGHSSRVESLGLAGKEVIDIAGLSDDLKPRQDVTVKATKVDGSTIVFQATVRIDTPMEVEYYRSGVILSGPPQGQEH
jgi:aconitate hydratase